MKNIVYKSVDRLDMFDPKINFARKMNRFALVWILVLAIIGVILNYVFRATDDPPGFYVLYTLAGVGLCVPYIYLHEYSHALAIILVKHERPSVTFEKLVASCGSKYITFSKAEYYLVTLFPFLLFCGLLIPLCILLPPLYFPMPFIPLLYNVFGSIGDFYMINRVTRLPAGGRVMDMGTEMVLYVPDVSGEK